MSEHWSLERLRELTLEWGDDCEGAIMHAWMRRHDAAIAQRDALAAALTNLLAETAVAGATPIAEAISLKTKQAARDALAPLQSPAGRQLDQENGND